MHGATVEPWSKTCPRYWATCPEVAAIFDELRDYRRGALGNVDDLPEALLHYLRVADAEHDAWEAENMRQIAGEAPPAVHVINVEH